MRAWRNSIGSGAEESQRLRMKVDSFVGRDRGAKASIAPGMARDSDLKKTKSGEPVAETNFRSLQGVKVGRSKERPFVSSIAAATQARLVGIG